MKTRLFPYVCLIVAGLLILLSPQTASAQDDQDQQAPPTRVATLDYTQGSVSYQPSGEQDWVQAELNRPLTTGDNLWSDQDSRAELFVGSTALRMGDSTGISFLNLSDQVAQIQLAEGRLEVDVRYLDPNESYEIDTPNLAFSVLRPGDYVIYAEPNGGSTSVSVYSGQGTVTGGGQTYNVTPGQDAMFTGTNQLSENVRGLRSDQFVDWARSRDMREEHSEASRYVSPGVTGYEDLDQYGSWRSDPEYGNYWVPSDVDSGWAPYHVGHWAWIAPWGWTWVDAEPWGFAPFHYGRWAEIEGRWGWIPGPVAVAPVYAPALVGFVGGGGFGVAVGFGSTVGVGWFPLGPRDVYVPPYQVDARYVERINDCDTRYVPREQITTVYNNYTVNHITNVNYMYANNTRAVTVVNRQAFVSGQRVEHGAIRVDAAQISHPRVVTTATLTPTRASVVGASARASRRPPASVAQRRVVSKLKPSPRAEPLGRPRPATNPNLTSAVLHRSGYSPQAQLVRAKAAASAPAHAATPERPVPAARPGQPTPNRPAARPETRPVPPARPGVTPNRPAARPETRPATPERPGVTRPTPERPGEPARPVPNSRRPEHPFTPPNRPTVNPRPTPTRPQPESTPRNRPEATPRTQPNARPAPTERAPNRPMAEPNRAAPARPPVREPIRPEARPAERPNTPAERPQPRPIPERTAPRPAVPPAREPARPEPRSAPAARPRPASRPAARPAAKPQPRKPEPPPKKKPGGPGGGI